MRVSRRLLEHCSEYVGVDVVPDMIACHQRHDWGEHVSFRCLDVVDDDLPDGDVCLVRQVLQHLSNSEICKVLTKLKKYPVAFITEHYPTDGPHIVANVDMVHGRRVRVYENSGVYLDQPPFCLPTDRLALMLEVPGIGLGDPYDRGVIRTFKLQSDGIPIGRTDEVDNEKCECG